MFWLKIGELEGARDALEHAKSVSPLNFRTRLSLVDLWRALGREDKANEELDGIRAIGIQLQNGFRVHRDMIADAERKLRNGDPSQFSSTELA